jgi:hypothetical protein
MPKNKLFTLVSLIALLAMIAAAAAVASRVTPQALNQSDPDMLVPAASKVNPNFKAQPVAGAPATRPWANFRVNTDSSSESQNEPFVAVNPSNPSHLVVGANNWAGGNGQFDVTAYASFDGGRTWTASQPYVNRNASRLNAADSTVAFGADGSVYFAFVAFGPADGAVAVSRSVDGGRTWTSQTWATAFTSAADKPTLAQGNGNLYLFWQTASALLGRVSSNNGASWGATVTVAAGGRNASPVVDAKGAVNVFYTAGNNLQMSRSTDNGASYRTTTVSTATPLQPRAAQFRATVYPTAGAGADGALYVAWADGRNAGHGNDILAAVSRDGGSTWSVPTVVNHDSGVADQLMPALTVGADGAVTVAWLDTRNDAARVNYDVYMARTDPKAASMGFNFGDNVRVTNVASNPNNDPRLQGSMIGDYFAIAAGAGVVYPVWTDTRNNNEDIFLAPVPVTSGSNN